jgi:Co/Zn/Cd efflux system component
MAVKPELLAYLQKEVAKGITEQQLHTFLSGKGYTKEALDEAFAALHGNPAATGKKTNTAAIVAFALVMLSLLMGLVGYFLVRDLLLYSGGIGTLMSITAFILGIVAVRRIKKRGERGKAFGIIGIVMGGLSIVGIIMVVLLAVLLKMTFM